MLAIFPLFSFLLLFFLWGKNYGQWRRGILLAAISWGCILVFITELLSLINKFNLAGLSIAWLATDLILLSIVLRKRSQKHFEITLFPKKSTFYLRFLLIGVGVIVIAVGITAILSPPNNWDSMTYHMGRVVNWIQAQNVNHYPTGIVRQLYPGPWSSFAIANLQVLSGGDRLANLVQWFSLVGSLVGVSLIAQQLGASTRGQIISVVVSATIPMGILQGSSTQNDYVTAFWLICLAYFGIEAIQSKFRSQWIVAAGASLGLALLTKGTAYLYAFPFCIWFLLSSLRWFKGQFWKPILGFSVITLALNLPHYTRNFKVFNSVLGESGQGLGVTGPRILVSNILRNSALHFGTPVRSINLITIRIIEFLHRLIGVDASDPRTTTPVDQQFDIHSLINHEDLGGNPLHFLSFLIATGAFLCLRHQFKQRRQYFVTAYGLSVVAGFLLFCGLIIWSPWRSRLHLPLFVLAAPFIGTIFSDILGRRFSNITAALLLTASIIWVGFNETRPLVFNSQIVETGEIQNIFTLSRNEQYFTSKPDNREPYLEAVQFLQSTTCSDIGLRLGGDSWEYPIWALMDNHARPKLHIEHVDVSNQSALISENQKRSVNFIPCALLAVGSKNTPNDQIIAFQNTYQRQWTKDNISIFTVRKSLRPDGQ